MMTTTTEQQHELQRDASKLAYLAIRFSGLWKELSGAEWDAMADKFGGQLVAILEAAVDDELTRREAEREEMDEWLSSK